MIQRRSLLLMAPRTLEWIPETLPMPAAHEILLETCAGAISVGTELPQYRGSQRSSQSLIYPKMTGYESVGRVVACGEAVRDAKTGMRMVAFYGHRTHALVPSAKAIRIPDDIPDALALLAILSCDVTKGIAKVNVQSSDHVLVTGAGVIGLLTVFNLLARGVTHVDVSEPLAARRALAVRFGARRVLTPDELGHATEMYDVGFECASRQTAFAALQERMRAHGAMCVLSDGNIEPLTLLPVFHERELCVAASSDGDDYPSHAAWFFERLRNSASPLRELFEWQIAATDLPQAFAQMSEAAHPPLKVFVRY